MKYLISYRQQLKITPARRLLLALHSSPASSSSAGASRPAAQSFAAPRFVPHKKRLFPGKRITLRAQTYTGQAAGKPAAAFLSN
jgi:hypothetical protein